ncbi:Eukaryotic peptide chain release factor subunit 1-3, partial [Linum perenne]
FHTEPLKDMLESEDRFGFIVIAENGALFKTLKGNTPEVLHNFSVDLPKNHGRGMWSLDFGHLRMEQRQEYVRKTAELARQVFIDSAISEPNISGLILAGTADLHVALSKSDMFDPRFQARVLNVVQVSYGGEMGFAAAVDLSKEVLSSSRTPRAPNFTMGSELFHTFLAFQFLLRPANLVNVLLFFLCFFFLDFSTIFQIFEIHDIVESLLLRPLVHVPQQHHQTHSHVLVSRGSIGDQTHRRIRSPTPLLVKNSGFSDPLGSPPVFFLASHSYDIGIKLFARISSVSRQSVTFLWICDLLYTLSLFRFRFDSSFHTKALKDILESEDRFGFIVMAENGALKAGRAIQLSVIQTILYRLSRL